MKQRVDNHRNPAGAVTFVADLVKISVILAAGRAFEHAIDIILRHIGCPTRQYGRAQAWIRIRISTRFGRHLDLADQTREDLGALFVLRALAMHDVLEL
jgi:hypothetical protein